MKVSMTIEKLSFTAIAAACGAKLVEAKQYDDKATKLREEVNKDIIGLHKAKVVIGRLGQCSSATSFVDSLIKGGLAKKTAQNYLSLFKEAVKTGKPVLDWGGTKAGKRNAVTGTTGTKGKKEFADLFRPSFNHNKGNSFMALCKAIEKDYKDDKIKSMYAGFVEYFKAEGDEIAE